MKGHVLKPSVNWIWQKRHVVISSNDSVANILRPSLQVKNIHEINSLTFHGYKSTYILSLFLFFSLCLLLFLFFSFCLSLFLFLSLSLYLFSFFFVPHSFFFVSHTLFFVCHFSFLFVSLFSYLFESLSFPLSSFLSLFPSLPFVALSLFVSLSFFSFIFVSRSFFSFLFVSLSLFF